MVAINWDTPSGAFISYVATNFVGSLEGTVFFIVIGLLALALMFRVPIEFTAIIILPLIIGCMAYYQSFITFGGILLFYVSMIFVKHLFFNK